MMIQSSSSAANDHSRTALVLSARGLEFDKNRKSTPPSLDHVVVDFHRALQSLCGISPAPDLSINQDHALMKIWAENFEKEVDFDAVLFATLKTWLSGFVSRESSHENFILLNSGDDDRARYAVGFARQVYLARNLLPKTDRASRREDSSSSGGLRGECFSEHVVCLFEKNRGEWLAKDTLALVELKLSDTNCKLFEIRKNPNLARDHGPLAQALLYNIGSILLCQAKLGVRRNDYIPISIVAGKRNQQTSNKICRWVSSRLYIPQECGNRFTYSVECFDGFHNPSTSKQQETTSITHALAVYLDTLLYGLKLAIDAYKALAAGQQAIAVPASGVRPLIGNGALQFCASPIAGATTLSCSSRVFKVSQGDLFQGRLKMSDIPTPFFEGDICEQASDVLVKVSSTSVHSLLIDPKDVALALAEVKEDASLKAEIGSVLLAVFRMDVGLMTVMADLSVAGYGALRPSECGATLGVLWAGFADVVKQVLIPLASRGLIHPDIRPGYDETSNILVRMEEVLGSTKATMKLIDYESLIQFRDWLGSDDGRYLARGHKNPTDFVWRQCIFMAYVWKNELTANQVKGLECGDGITMALHSSNENELGEAWLILRDLLAYQKADADAIGKTLSYLASNWFPAT